MSYWRFEGDEERVIPVRGQQRLRHFQLVAGEHVIGAAQEMSVEVDGGGGVQTLAVQHERARQRARVQHERRAVQGGQSGQIAGLG